MKDTTITAMLNNFRHVVASGLVKTKGNIERANIVIGHFTFRQEIESRIKLLTMNTNLL